MWLRLLAGTLLVGSTLAASAQPVGDADWRLFGLLLHQSLDSLARKLDPIAVVTEDRRVDAIVVAWGGPATARLPPDRIQVAAALASGVSIIAGPMGRSQLELLGFRLAHATRFQEPYEFAWSRVTGELTCTEVSTQRWSQLPGLEYTGKLGVKIPGGSGGELSVIVADDLPLVVRATFPDGEVVPVTLEPLDIWRDANVPPAAYWLNTTETRKVPAHVARLRVEAKSSVRQVGLHLGRRGPRVLARLAGYRDSELGQVCAAPLPGEPLDAVPGPSEVPLSQDEWMGTGWHPAEYDTGGLFRRTSAAAALLVTTRGSRGVRVIINAAPEGGEEGRPELALALNGIALGGRRMRSETSRYEWAVRPGAWSAGTNELLLQMSRARRPTTPSDARPPGVIVRRVTIDFGR
jgi:hypothetical protein